MLQYMQHAHQTGRRRHSFPPSLGMFHHLHSLPLSSALSSSSTLLLNGDTQIPAAVALLRRIYESGDEAPQITSTICLHCTPHPALTEELVQLIACLDDDHVSTLTAVMDAAVQLCSESEDQVELVSNALRSRLELDRKLLVPVIGAMGDLALTPKMRQDAFQLAVDALDVVDEDDMPAVARTLLRTAPGAVVVNHIRKNATAESLPMLLEVISQETQVKKSLAHLFLEILDGVEVWTSLDFSIALIMLSRPQLRLESGQLIQKAVITAPVLDQTIAAFEGLPAFRPATITAAKLLLETSNSAIACHMCVLIMQKYSECRTSLISSLAATLSRPDSSSFCPRAFEPSHTLKFNHHSRQMNTVSALVDISKHVPGLIPAHLLSETLQQSRNLSCPVLRRLCVVLASIARDELLIHIQKELFTNTGHYGGIVAATEMIIASRQDQAIILDWICRIWSELPNKEIVFACVTDLVLSDALSTNDIIKLLETIVVPSVRSSGLVDNATLLMSECGIRYDAEHLPDLDVTSKGKSSKMTWTVERYLKMGGQWCSSLATALIACTCRLGGGHVLRSAVYSISAKPNAAERLYTSNIMSSSADILSLVDLVPRFCALCEPKSIPPSLSIIKKYLETGATVDRVIVDILLAYSKQDIVWDDSISLLDVTEKLVNASEAQRKQKSRQWLDTSIVAGKCLVIIAARHTKTDVTFDKLKTIVKLTSDSSLAIIALETLFALTEGTKRHRDAASVCFDCLSTVYPSHSDLYGHFPKIPKVRIARHDETVGIAHVPARLSKRHGSYPLRYMLIGAGSASSFSDRLSFMCLVASSLEYAVDMSQGTNILRAISAESATTVMEAIWDLLVVTLSHAPIPSQSQCGIPTSTDPPSEHDHFVFEETQIDADNEHFGACIDMISIARRIAIISSHLKVNNVLGSVPALLNSATLLISRCISYYSGDGEDTTTVYRSSLGRVLSMVYCLCADVRKLMENEASTTIRKHVVSMELELAKEARTYSITLQTLPIPPVHDHAVQKNKRTRESPDEIEGDGGYAIFRQYFDVTEGIIREKKRTRDNYGERFMAIKK